MELSVSEYLELARRIVASVVAEQENDTEIAKAVEGIEDVLTGEVRALSETEFHARSNDSVLERISLFVQR